MKSGGLFPVTEGYSAGRLLYVGAVTLSDVEGTPMMAAPSRAATAVTASKAVFKFTARLLGLAGMQGICRPPAMARNLSRAD